MPDRYLAEDRIRRIGCPEDLKSKEENEWAGGRGTEVWAMLSAAMRGDLQAVQDLVATNPRLATCSYGYRSPLHFAVQGNHIEVVQFLLAQGADATFQSGVFWHIQPLLTAEERGYGDLAAILKEHLAEKAGVREGGDRIAAAIRGRDVGAVEELLKAEPNLIEAADSRGNKPIHWAVMIRSIAMIDLIIKRGGEINSRRPDGARPLDLSDGDYFFRGWRDVPSEALAAHEVLIGYLIARGADYDIAVAAKIGDTERVRQLLRADPDLATAVPAYSTYYSGHPLRNACALGDVDTVELLLASGADPNTPEPGIAPRGGALHAAAGKGHLKIARMLLERGADPNAEVESSGNCMHIAGRNTKMLKLLASYGGEYAPYQDLSQLSKQALKAVYGNEMPLRYYVQKIDMPVLIARIDANPALAAEVLEMASGSCDAESTRLVRYCVARDPVAAEKVRANELIYMLHRLNGNQEAEMAERIAWLLAAGMDPDDSDWLRVTALHRLAIGSQDHGSDGTRYRPHLEVLRHFIRAGAELDARDEELHATPLGWAARWGRKEMVQVLLAAGAKTNLPGDLPWATPLAWARQKGHAEIEAMLLAAGASC